MEPDIEYPYLLYTHCGIEWLGRFNDVNWRAGAPDAVGGFIPRKWRAAVDEKQDIEVLITLRTDPEPTIEAVANGHAVIYRPTTEVPPGCY
jgi:hypothetical protein